ncbi:hypothetical protein Bca4012_057433 [Brassica carinata]
MVTMTIPDEILADPNPLWRCYVVGYFIGDPPHVGSIHATVNRLWSTAKMGSKIDVQFLEKNTVLFRIENPQARARVINRKDWHKADVPLVVNEWSPGTALAPPDLSAIPIWIDLKGVPSLMFSHKTLKCLSRATGKFVKLHPNTEKCTRLDVARVLVEVNLHKTLVEKISFQDKDGENVVIDVSYPWLPPRCTVCSGWGHKGASCTSKKIQVLQKDKEVAVSAEGVDVVINGDGKVRYEIAANRNVVSDLLLELEGLPPALGSNVVGDESRKEKEIGSTSKSVSDVGDSTTSKEEWPLVNGKALSLPLLEKQQDAEGEERVKEGNDLISPSRFSVLEKEGFDDSDVIENVDEDKMEEGEVVTVTQKTGAKAKNFTKSVRFPLGALGSCQATFAAAAEAADKRNNLAAIEEKIFRQKSCIKWLGAGDHNTVFFHRAVQTRSARNNINRLVREDGIVLTNLADIKSEAVLHFQKFLQVQDQGEEGGSYTMNEPVPEESGGGDVVLWKHSDDDFKPCFSSAKTWDQIRERKATVFWSKSVWFQQGVPRFSFIIWLAVKNRLSTGDRMRSLGIQQGCVLCGEPDETWDHIFFACPYSFTVWDNLVNRLTGSRSNLDWMVTLQFVSRNNLRLVDKILLKMAFQTCIYHVWTEINERRHQRGFRTVV